MDIAYIILNLNINWLKNKAHPRAIQTVEDLMKIWVHECQRVFYDRLISQQDQIAFNRVIAQIVKQNTHF
jgi:hypothetical protein